MKLRKLNQAGVAHYLLPALVVVIVGLIGAKVLTASHADAPTTVALTAATADSTPGKNVAILNYTQTAAGTPSSQSSVPYSFIGYQTVNVLGTGQSLAYSQGIKGDVTACYYIFVQQPKVGTVTAKVEIANNNNYKTVNLSSSSTDNLQQVCINPGKKANPGFDVKNATSIQQNTAIEVYQDVLTWQ